MFKERQTDQEYASRLKHEAKLATFKMLGASLAGMFTFMEGIKLIDKGGAPNLQMGVTLGLIGTYLILGVAWDQFDKALASVSPLSQATSA